jgi:tryptophan-rich sensory protein
MQLAVSIVAVFAAAVIGSLFTGKSVRSWYPGLKKPAFTPPNGLFGPVWTVLYILMVVSVFLVWQQGLDTAGVLPAFILFWVQLVFNALWSIVFFGMKSKGGGIIVIGILWLLILATIITSFQVSVWAGILLVPYILWVSLASYLNIGIWVVNKSTRS